MNGVPLTRQNPSSVTAPKAIPQALVCAGARPRACRAEESRLPAEKHKVPPSAQANPENVAMSPAWPATCGQNKRSRPPSPSTLPAITCGAISRCRRTRASNAFHSVDVEKTTATRPLGMVRLAFRKQTKLKQNRQSPCAAISPYDAVGGRRSVFFHPSSTNRMIAASAKR